MSLQAQVKDAENPKVALEAIARYLDHLNTKVDAVLKIAGTAPEHDDGWGQWDDPETHEEVAQDFERLEKIELLRKAIEVEQDAMEADALRAQLRLLEDEGSNIKRGLDEAKHSKITQGDDEAIVDLPPPTDEQLEQRAHISKFLSDYGLDPEYIDSYIKGGPLVLYLSDRDMVNGLPNNVKTAMVQDVEINSPKEAHEMARDILKSTDPDTLDITIERQKLDQENHGR